MRKVTIYIQGEEQELECGVYSEKELKGLCNLDDGERIMLDITGELDIPIGEDDYVCISGDERFIKGEEQNAPDNPNLRNNLPIVVNDSEQTISRAKVNRCDIANYDQELVNCEVYVYIDLPDMPDFYLKEGYRFIVKSKISFITIPRHEDGIVDIEECAKHNRRPPKHQKQYRIKVDGKKYVVNESHLKGKEILELAGLEWQRYDLQQKFCDGKREAINWEDRVDFSQIGVERFESIPREAQQG